MGERTVRRARRTASCADLIELRVRRWREGGVRKDGTVIKAGDITADRELTTQFCGLIMAQNEQGDALTAEIREKPWLLVEMIFTVITKERKEIPFIINPAQELIKRKLEKHGGRGIFNILKGRQMGVTTYLTDIGNAASIRRRNFSGLTLADTTDNTITIFSDRGKQTVERLPMLPDGSPFVPPTKYSNRKELFYDSINSRWMCETASADVGRSRTLDFLHLSEVAFFDCALADVQAGLINTAPDNAMIFLESTANGFNDYKLLWDSGMYINIFIPWWLDPGYRRAGHEFTDKASGWLVERIVWLREQGLDDEQIEWYAHKYDQQLEKDKLKQEYPCTPEEAFIFSGVGIFDNEKLAEVLVRADAGRPFDKVGQFEYRKVAKPVRGEGGTLAAVEYSLTDVRWVERSDGMIRIHAEPEVRIGRNGEPDKAAPYVIGGDTAGSGTDYFTAKVVHAETRRVAATLRVQHIDDDQYAEQVLCLAQYFNDAFTAIEINYSRQPVKVLQMYGYTNLYRRQVVTAGADKPTGEPGFATTPITKPIIVSNLQILLRECPDLDRDVNTIRELMTFVRKPNGATEAVDGAHDDLVMALAIAEYACTQAPMVWEPVKGTRAGSVADLLGIKRDEGHAEGGNFDFMDWEDF